MIIVLPIIIGMLYFPYKLSRPDLGLHDTVQSKLQIFDISALDSSAVNSNDATLNPYKLES